MSEQRQQQTNRNWLAILVAVVELVVVVVMVTAMVM